MTCVAYEFLKEFQTAIVGVLGFVGVILTLNFNARLARRQHKLEQAERRKVVEIGLHEEFRAFLQMVERNIEHLDPGKGGYLNIPRIRPVISDHLIQDVGMLERGKAQAALKGVMTMQDLNRKLTLLALGVSDDYITVVGLKEEHVIASYRSALPNLREAVDALTPIEWP